MRLLLPISVTLLSVALGFGITEAFTQDYRVKQYIADEICVGGVCENSRFRFSVDHDYVNMVNVEDSNQRLSYAIEKRYKENGIEYVLISNGLVKLGKSYIEIIVDHVYIRLRIEKFQTHYQW